MKRKIFIALLFITLNYSNEQYLRGDFSYPVVSDLSNDSIKFKSAWGLEYNISINNRIYGLIGFEDVYWLSNKRIEGGGSTAGGSETPNSMEYLSFFAGISYDLLKYQHFNLNTGIGGGLLFHFYRCNGENYYPHYFISFSPRFPLNNWLCLGVNYWPILSTHRANANNVQS
jgi:hypothetical protein